jgi:hypothetical protein
MQSRLQRFSTSGASNLVEGDSGFQGTLSVAKEAPVGFKNIPLKVDFDTMQMQNRSPD